MTQRVQLREAILKEAAKKLAKDGPTSLSVRAVAQSVGASTKVIYSHFGGKPGLIEGIYEYGFDRLAQEMSHAVKAASGPVEALRGAAGAYRRFALSDPHLYELMYGPTVREMLPDRQARSAATPSLDVLIGVIKDGRTTEIFRVEDARIEAYRLWACMHGAVSLELTEWTDPEDQSIFDDLVERTLAVLMI